MDQASVRCILQQVAGGTLSVEDALDRLRLAPFTDLGFAKLDDQRGLRQGAAEVIYGAGKTPAQITEIAAHMLAQGEPGVLITRLAPEAAEVVGQAVPLQYYEMGRIGVAGVMPPVSAGGEILVITGGTSDMPVAEEAARTAEFLGNRVNRVYDVGVAGLHRLLAHAGDILRADVIIAIAGMEGALASVVGGLADCPVIAVPTSVGYGAAFGGLTALLAMLNSCASGVSVVNIDNGFGAGYLASMINHKGQKEEERK